MHRALRALIGTAALVLAGAAAEADDLEIRRPLALRLLVMSPSSPLRDQATTGGGLEYELAPDNPTGSFSVSAYWIHMRLHGGEATDAIPVLLNRRWWSRWRGGEENGSRWFGGVGTGAAYVSGEVPGLVNRGFTLAWNAFAGIELAGGPQVDVRLLSGRKLSDNMVGIGAGYRF